MRRLERLLISIAVLALLGGAGVAITTPAEAADTAILEIHKRVCPTDSPSDLFAECHDIAPEQPIAFSLDGGEAGEVDAAGDITFNDLAAGPHAVSEVEGIPLEFVNLRVFCSVQGTGEPAFEVVTDGPNFEVTLPEAAHVVCDVYNIPVDLSGLPDDAEGTLELHKRVCPAGAPTTSIFDECHGTPPSQEVSFSVDGGAPVAVDEEGNVIFIGLAPGSHQVTEIEGIPLEFVELRVYCSVRGSGLDAFETTTDGPTFTVEIGPAEDVVCDIYNIPVNLSGLTPTAPAGPPAPTAVAVVGRPAGIFAGDCELIPEAPDMALTDVTRPRGDTVGSADAAISEVSFTAVGVSLDSLLTEEHAIVVQVGRDDSRAVVCGEIGGRMRDDGSLVIGLREQNGLGFVGIAYVVADSEHAGTTLISVFIARRLAEEDQPTPTPT
jgi:hypothetical protein